MPPITLTPAQVYALAMYGSNPGNALRVGQPMFLVKPDFDPLDPDVSLKMEKADALHLAPAPRLRP